MHCAFTRRVVSLSILGVSTAFATTALADDLNPPTYRGQPRSTSAEWDFLTNQPSPQIQPDGTTVPLVVGDFKAQLDAAFPASAPHPSGATFGSIAWTDAQSNGGYLGSAGGNPPVLAFNVPNWIDNEPLKLLRLQITYSGPTPGTSVQGFLGVPGSSDAVVEDAGPLLPQTSPSLPEGMNYVFQDWTMQPNPDWEQVVIFLQPGTFIDQVVIDSISLPEPAAFAALASVSLLLRRRRVE